MLAVAGASEPTFGEGRCLVAADALGADPTARINASVLTNNVLALTRTRLGLPIIGDVHPRSPSSRGYGKSAFTISHSYR